VGKVEVPASACEGGGKGDGASTGGGEIGRRRRRCDVVGWGLRGYSSAPRSRWGGATGGAAPPSPLTLEFADSLTPPPR